MQQLGISGEIQQMTSKPEEALFNFRVITPRRRYNIKADFRSERATIEKVQVNAWGVLYALHLFDGVQMGNPGEQRDWIMTKIWSLLLDVVAIGLIIMVLGGIYIWYPVKHKRRLGWVALGLGILSCGFFVFGLGRM